MSVSPKTKDVLQTVGSFVSTFIMVIVAAIAVMFVLIKIFGWNLFTVESGSMEPTLPVGSVVVVANTDPSEISEGDIITFMFSDSVMVTHRVKSVDSTNHTFTTKGDANDQEDASPVKWANVIGTVKFCIPAIGGVVSYITDEANRPVVIVMIVALLAVSIGWDIFASRRKKKKKAEAQEPSLPEENSGSEKTV